jgi:hypothetical protein
MALEKHVMGFNDYPKQVEAMLEANDWDEKLNRLRMGLVLTFATEIPYHGGATRFFVDELQSGQDVYLQHPGQNNKGFDFQLRVEGWDDSAAPRPSHDDIYSDYAHKREHATEEAFNALCEAAYDIHEGHSPDDVIDRYSDKFEFTQGRTPEAILRALPWLFIEQDITYWHGEGRDMTIELISHLHDGGSKGEINDFQTLEEINETELAIQNQEV